MTHDLKPYPATKDSGVPWLGDVPEHWERVRLKRILRPVDHRSSTGSETLLSLRRDHGVVVYADHFSRPPQGATTVGFKLVRAGQLVVNRMQANNGLVFHSRLDGLVSPDYSVFEASCPLLMDYLSELLRTPLYRAHFRRESTGLGTGSAGFLRLYDDRLLNTIVAAPTLAEQAAIVRFLDHADRRIRRYIRAKQKLIKLLEEQKQAIIQSAVTRGLPAEASAKAGLDPNVRVKPSGVEWLGDVPKHWEVWQIGKFARVGNGSTPSRGNPLYWNGGSYPWLNSSYANQESVAQADQFVTEVALRECHLPIVHPDSVLVAITGQGKTRGKATVLRIEATINQHIAFVTPVPAICSAEYLRLSLTGAYPQLRAMSDDSGSTKGALTCADLKHFKLALPPLAEQSEILRFVGAQTQKCGLAIERANREVALLREYRTRLIADVVTGKLDVREAAARLPDDPDEAEALDEEEPLGEGDEESEGADLDAAPEEAGA